MCTFKISVSDTLIERARPAIGAETDIATWMQQQMEMLLLQISSKSQDESDHSHRWDDYELSPEILAMTPRRRGYVYDNYEEVLTDTLAEKYK